MRPLPPIAALLLAGCAHLGAPAPPPGPLAISPDGQSVEAGGETWIAPEGAAFFQRNDVLHVVSTAPGRTWDVAVPFGADGRLAWPAAAPFEAVGGRLVPRGGGLTPEVEELVASGQLHPHDDHYHLTHRFQSEDWQALYRLRADDSPLPPIRRQVAATVLALLLDARLPGSSAAATDAAVARTVRIIGKARRAVEGDVGARAIEGILDHDLEIRDEGRTLELEGAVFRAAEPIRFSYCAGHFHVGDAGGTWAQTVEFAGGANGAFAWPPSIFFEVRDGATVAELPAITRSRKLIASGQVHFSRDHWHLSERYANPRLQSILRTIEDRSLPEPLRDRARGVALEILRLRLDVGSEAEFAARLDAIDQAIERSAAELEREARAAPKKIK